MIAGRRRAAHAWRTSSYSGNNNNTQCVEVLVRPDTTMVRDSKGRAAGTLTFGRTRWLAFVAEVTR